MKCRNCQTDIIENLTLIEWFKTPEVLCFRCEQQFSRLKGKITCPGCGRINDGELCADCQRWQKIQGYTLQNQALFAYDEGFQQWVEAYKFKGDYRLRKAFARELKQELRNYSDFLFCPIPLSKERFSQRGFNQVIACLEADDCSYKILLERKKDDRPQSMKNRFERLQMPQPYKLKGDESKIKDKKILIIDDVYTTGRTLFHASEILYKNGAKAVQSLTFAR
ncbi:ComF family protein [Enterococcus sp. AZ072]|uniref:ComF family protein n=1 Tax=unclassified Enterococcus TaxID=2608891 RepID=UPI003D274771